jgi:O-6-methylguanine DNA methyltransferase
MKIKSSETFVERVRAVVRTIPKGKTLSYKTVAEKAGNPKAARAAARIMAGNYDETVPCHRVIRSDGTLGGYNRGGVRMKRKLLVEEGVIVKQS